MGIVGLHYNSKRASLPKDREARSSFIDAPESGYAITVVPLPGAPHRRQ
jgi:hypothetical protein